MTRMLRLTAALLFTAAAALPGHALSEKDKDEVRAVVKQYLIENPEIIEEALNELKRKQEESETLASKAAISENAGAIFRSEADLVAGNKAGKVTMVEFFDYNCGYCKRAMGDVMKMVETDGDLRLVMKELPILGPGSVYAAKAALASRQQGKYWEYHLALMKHEGRMDEASALAVAAQVGLDVEKLKKDMESPDVASVINATSDLANKLNIGGTPAFIIDETLIPGAIGYEGLAAAVQEVRAAGGCKVC